MEAKLLYPVFDLSSQHTDVDGKIVASLERISQVFRSLLREKAQKYSLSPIQTQLLIYLLYHDAELCRIGRLAKEYSLTPATVSDAVASLEMKGFVNRNHWPEDKRIMTLQLTEEGEQLAGELSAWADIVREHVTRSSTEEKEIVLGFLMQLIESLQKAGVISISRMCTTCRFFQRNANPGSGSPHHCGLMDLPLAASDLRVDCPEHVLARKE